MIFSKYRKKLEPRRRFGSKGFRTRLAQARNYKRLLVPPRLNLFRNRQWRGAGLVVLLVAAYYLIVSDRLLITNIEVVGTSQVGVEQIQSVMAAVANNRWLLIKQNHYLLMTRGRTDGWLREALPDIKQVVSVDRDFPHGIVIEVEERKPGFILINQGRQFYVDEEGAVVKELAGESHLIKVSNQNPEETVVAGEMLSNKLVVFIVSMARSWPSQMEQSIGSIQLTSKESREVQFKSGQGWSVFFDITRPVSEQLSNLALILNRQIALSDRSRLAYIDLRSSKWVYYCFINTACDSQSIIKLEGETGEE